MEEARAERIENITRLRQLPHHNAERSHSTASLTIGDRHDQCVYPVRCKGVHRVSNVGSISIPK